MAMAIRKDHKEEKKEEEEETLKISQLRLA